MNFLHVTDQQPARPPLRDDLLAWLRDLKEPAPWTGLTAIAWARTFSFDLTDRIAAAGNAELDQHLSRKELGAFCARKDVPLAFRVAAVMGWGRSNARNRQNNLHLWASMEAMTPLLERLPTLTRHQAFAEFRQLVDTGALRGMRASFFTKLMFFFGSPGAYILDQWMAKAVLALLAANWRSGEDGKQVFTVLRSNFVRLGYGGTSIHPAMSEDDYEKYCLTLESLVGPLGREDGADVERWLFSDPRSDWRRYLRTLDWQPEPVRP